LTTTLKLRLGLLRPDQIWDQASWIGLNGFDGGSAHHVFGCETNVENVDPAPASGLFDIDQTRGVYGIGQNIKNVTGGGILLNRAAFSLRRFDSQPAAQVWAEVWKIDQTTLVPINVLSVSERRDFDDINFGVGAAFFRFDWPDVTTRIGVQDDEQVMIRLNGTWTGDAMLRVAYKDNVSNNPPNPGIGNGAPGRWAYLFSQTNNGSQGFYPGSYSSMAAIPSPTTSTGSNVTNPDALYGSFTDEVDAPGPALEDTLYEWGDADLSPDFEMPLGALIQAYVRAPFYHRGFPITILMDPVGGGTESFMNFFSKEAGSKDPVLTVKYIPAGTHPHKRRRRCR
jgi:hypothetical protein